MKTVADTRKSPADAMQRRSAPPAAARRVVVALSISSFALWVGAGSVLPLLPLFLKQHGSSDAMVGATMAAYFAAAFFAQYPAGRLSDRIGRRPIQLGGLGLYAAASVAFAFAGEPVTALFLRALQGTGAGVVLVASAAVIGETVPEGWRGRAFGLFYGCSTAGLAIGPLAGTLVGPGSMNVLFLAAATCAALACVPILWLVPGGRPPRSNRAGRAGPMWRRPVVLGVMSVAVAQGLLIGTYEVCWTLLLHLRGASTWEIGLSWTLFAVPFVAMSVPAGWLVDRFDRRYLAGLSLLASAGFAAVYPFIHQVPLLIGLGVAEACAVALAAPAMLSHLSDNVAPAEMGRGQGIVASSQTAATAVAAAGAGAMFGIAPRLPFLVTAAAVLLATALLPIFWAGSKPGLTKAATSGGARRSGGRRSAGEDQARRPEERPAVVADGYALARAIGADRHREDDGGGDLLMTEGDDDIPRLEAG